MRQTLVIIFSLICGLALGFVIGQGRQKNPTIIIPASTNSALDRVVFHDFAFPIQTGYHVTSRSPVLTISGLDVNTDRGEMTVSSEPINPKAPSELTAWVHQNYSTAQIFGSTVAKQPAITFLVPQQDFPSDLASTKTIFNVGMTRYIVETRGWTLQMHMQLLDEIETAVKGSLQ